MKFKEIKNTRKKIVLDPYLNKWLANQGFDKKSISKLDHEERDPSTLHDIEKAAELLSKAIHDQASITVCGDYDADGICGTTILVEGLKNLGMENVDYMIPHRSEGYGLNIRMVDEANDRGSTILLTVDNGIACIDAIAHAKDLGMTVIITDHHTIPDTLPDADAIVHPQLPGYPFKDISGATVAYKLMRYLFTKEGKTDEYANAVLEYFCCLAGITVISDVMPLRDENRTIWKNSVWFLANDMEENLSYLLDIANIDKNHIDETTYGFSICPMLNAVGRLSSAEYGVRFLLSTTKKSRLIYGAMLSALNDERKLRQNDQLQKIEGLIDASHSGIVVFNDTFDLEEGLIGIIAGRVCQQYKKPTIIFTKTENNIWKASARSTEDVNIYNVLSEMAKKDKDLFINFGGHAGAAGMSIPFEKRDDFIRSYYDTVERLTVEYEQDYISVPERDIPPLLDAMRPYTPFGQGFPKPCVRTCFQVTDIKCYFKTNKCLLSDGKIDIWMELDKILPIIRDKDYRLTYTNFGKSLTETVTESTKTEFYRPRDADHIIQYDLIAGINNNYFGGKDTIQLDILQQNLL